MNKLLLVLLTLLPIASSAADWVNLGKSSDKQLQVFLDYSSVKRIDIPVFGSNSEYISAVFQMTYINNNPLRKKEVYYSKQQWFMSCEDNTYFLNAYVDYGFKDEVVDRDQSSKNTLFRSDFSYAFPETIADSNIDEACAVLQFTDAIERHQ